LVPTATRPPSEIASAVTRSGSDYRRACSKVFTLFTGTALHGARFSPARLVMTRDPLQHDRGLLARPAELPPALPRRQHVVPRPRARLRRGHPVVGLLAAVCTRRRRAQR